MVVGNMSSWMVMFAIDLTSVPVNDFNGRSEVVERYKQSALKCGITSNIPPVEIAEDASTPSATWVEPEEAVKIANDTVLETGVWSTPKEPIVIENSNGSPNGVWVAPKEAVTLGDSNENYHGRWIDPLYWGDGS